MVKIDHNPDRQLIHMVTAGSVDDGKSTLIGRMLHDCHAIYEDQLSSVKKTSQKKGFEYLDFSLFTDGLSAEREQGITIDVAYRYFSTPKRRFVIADVPGHEQYTRNMVTGASNADLALILIDARKGVLEQTKRHLFISSLLGIPHIAIVINKMDLVNYEEKVYNRIKKDSANFCAKLKIGEMEFIPVSSTQGDMVVHRCKNMNWYGGHTVFNYIDNLEIASDRNLIDFRFPIQYVLRPSQDMRGYAGKIEGGTIKVGENVKILPSNKSSKVKNIYSGFDSVRYAFNPQSIVIELEDEVDASRGEMIVRKNNTPDKSRHFQAMICWFSENKLNEGRIYHIKHTTRTTRGKINKIVYKLNIETLHREITNKLNINDIGRVDITVNDELFFDPYSRNRYTGSFIIIDEITNNTVGAGVIIKKNQSVADSGKINICKNKGAVLWFTGLSGSGKTTIADKVHEYLNDHNIPNERLDGDVIRKLLNKELGFSKHERNLNIERAAFLAGLLSKHGVIVLAAFISPFQDQRKLVRKKVDNFTEIFVNAPIEECEKRDVKGLYKKARSGEIKMFTGISDPYEAPNNPDIELKTNQETIEESTEKVIKYLIDNKIISE